LTIKDALDMWMSVGKVTTNCEILLQQATAKEF